FDFSDPVAPELEPSVSASLASQLARFFFLRLDTNTSMKRMVMMMAAPVAAPAIAPAERVPLSDSFDDGELVK
ncbi:hypothetical protein E4U19_000191, partial [Claviceps sp. Clav32 group G5]